MNKIKEDSLKSFQENGFARLKQLFSKSEITLLKQYVHQELVNDSGNYSDNFSRVKYDSDKDKSSILDLLKKPSFSNKLHSLTGKILFLAFMPCFELKKNVSTGFPWHVGVQSFGYQQLNDFGCSLWIPLSPINPKKQAGGMRYVPKNIFSGKFIYKYVEPGIVKTLEHQRKRGENVTLDDYFFLREKVLNSNAMLTLLEEQAREDVFELGDALLFDKYVIHRSVPLGEGEIFSRQAIVMRFMDINSRYDQQRALNIDYPCRTFGYKPFTQSHIEIANQDKALLFSSSYFSDAANRVILPVI